jgi:hypothetical protein
MPCPCTPVIKRDGLDINPTTKKRYALPGELIHLQITGCTGIAPSTVQWTVPGKLFRLWNVSNDSGTLTPAILNGDIEPYFYWADAPGVVQISVQFQVNGQQCSAQAQMEVIAPTVTLLEVGIGNVQCFYLYYPGGYRKSVGLATYGPSHTGVYAKYRVDVPLSQTYGFSVGKTAFCQVFDRPIDRWRTVVDSVESCADSKDRLYTCLDTGFPARGFEFSTNTQDSEFWDSPSRDLEWSALREIYATFPARNYLMFKPGPDDAPNDWVPLRLIRWSASLCSKLCPHGGWKLLSKSKSFVGPSATSDHPLWNHYYPSGDYNPNPCPSCGSCGTGSQGCFDHATYI